MTNLDFEAQVAAQAILAGCPAEAAEGLATKALGALQESGVYACQLFLLSRGRRERKDSGKMAEELRKLAERVTGKSPGGAQTVVEILGGVSRELCGDAEVMLLTREVWQQALIYVRYGAKGAGA